MRFCFVNRMRHEAASETFFYGFECFLGYVAHKTPFHRSWVPVRANQALDSWHALATVDLRADLAEFLPLDPQGTCHLPRLVIFFA